MIGLFGPRMIQMTIIVKNVNIAVYTTTPIQILIV